MNANLTFTLKHGIALLDSGEYSELIVALDQREEAINQMMSDYPTASDREYGEGCITSIKSLRSKFGLAEVENATRSI